MKPKKGAKKALAKASTKKTESAAASASPFTYPATIRRRGKVVAEVKLESEDAYRWFYERMYLPCNKGDMEDQMKLILETSLHDDSKAGMPAHKAWAYSELFCKLWEWLKRLAAEAENPNVRSYAGRALGEVIHELGTRKGKGWIDQTKKKNEAFEDKLVPFPKRRGGKPPNEDLVRWIRSCLIRHDRPWLEAMETAQLVVLKKHKTLEKAWAAWHERQRLPTLHWQQENGDAADRPSELSLALKEHPFTQLSFEVLSKFETLWKVCLEDMVSKQWEAEKKSGKLGLKGDRSFVKRFGDRTTREAGYHVAKRHFEKMWMASWNRHCKQQAHLEALMNKELMTFRKTTPGATAEDLSKWKLKQFLEH